MSPERALTAPYIRQLAHVANGRGKLRLIERGLQSTDRGIPRAGMQVKNAQGEVVGEVTSGTFSPSLKKGIALALINPEFKVGDELTVDVRGRDSLAIIAKLPLVTSNVR